MKPAPPLHAIPETLDLNRLQEFLRDPLLLERLSDRVYELLQAEVRQQQERSQGYGRRL